MGSGEIETYDYNLSLGHMIYEKDLLKLGIDNSQVNSSPMTPESVKSLYDEYMDVIKMLSNGLQIDIHHIHHHISLGWVDDMNLEKFSFYASKLFANLGTIHPDYQMLAGRILAHYLHQTTPPTFTEAMHCICQEKRGKASFLSEPFQTICSEFANELNKAIQPNRDLEYNYFAIQTMMGGHYLNKSHDCKTILETPQYMFMRVAVALNIYENKNDVLKNILETYELLSTRRYIHATPTLFHAGLAKGQLSSCFLTRIPTDSIEGIYDTLKQTAQISKTAGGIGVAIHNIRASGSIIKTGRAHSSGIVPMLRVFNETAQYVDQNGKRKGGFSIYLEPWHRDIEAFLELRLTTGSHDVKTFNLFTALWVCDLFMERILKNEDWTLFSPDDTPDLHELWGDEFNKKYEMYESILPRENVKVIKARALWDKIIISLQQTGTPYILYKDAANRKSNQQHLGTITNSNLCAEIIEYCSKDEVAVCNLASINYASFVNLNTRTFDFSELHRITKIIIRNLNNVIDITSYPIQEAETSNLRHRPIGLGDVGLADCFQIMGYAYDSREAQWLNKKMAATVYHAALEASCELAQVHGPFYRFHDSPLAQGKFQQDLWCEEGKYNEYIKKYYDPDISSNMMNIPIQDKVLDWETLRTNIKKYGVRNSLLRACMPTASTSQLIMQSESFEPIAMNIFARSTNSGTYMTINTHMVRALEENSLWNENVVNDIIRHKGNLSQIPYIPKDIKNIFKTVYEIPMETQICMSAARGQYICQSQSFNMHGIDLSPPQLTKYHILAWRLGLKTSSYYTRSQQGKELNTLFTLPLNNNMDPEPMICKRESNCLACQ